ncbi:hypothetical protein ACWEQL_20015 [Kitasatospora sp. NPDC004240]
MSRAHGRPEDLERPERLWARAVTMAVVERAGSADGDYALDEDGLWCHATGAGGWWRLTLLDGGRAVFCGQDPDGSHTHDGDEQIDFLAGGPAWLPWEQLKDDASGNLLGFVYWWEDGAWHRIDYRDAIPGDGLLMAAPWVASQDEFLSLAAEPCDLRSGYDRFEAAAARFAELAESRAVDEAALAELLAWDRVEGEPEPGHDAALALAVSAGVTVRR